MIRRLSTEHVERDAVVGLEQAHAASAASSSGVIHLVCMCLWLNSRAGSNQGEALLLRNSNLLSIEATCPSIKCALMCWQFVSIPVRDHV